MINVDDIITKFVLNTVNLKNIHPNTVTFFGMFLNIIIFYVLTKPKPSLIFLAFLLFFRYLADGLDGGIAKKYNKKSKLGNTLDSVSDFIITLIFVHYIIKSFKLSYYFYLVYVVYIIFMLFGLDMADNHTSIKKYKNNIVMDIVPFCTTNSLFIYILFFFIVYNRCSTIK